MEKTPDQRDPDWPRYPETILCFSTSPKIEIDLRETPSPAALEALKAQGFGEPFAIMTAFDPHGENLSPEENELRRRQLNDTLTARGLRYLNVDCCSPDRSHCECSVAVIMPQQAALDLARDLDQVAIFWFDGQRFWIIGAIVETDPLMLPRSS
ncbi:MAG: DUF3293 domain-containing protein [Gemmatimonadaceae bacterium]